jgi:hypothetical protein
MIENYSELGSVAKIALARYLAGTLTSTQLETLVTTFKVTVDEQTYIVGNKP